MPHPAADTRMIKWQQIMKIPPSIICKNEYLSGGILLDDILDYLKEKKVKLPEDIDQYEAGQVRDSDIVNGNTIH